MTFRFAFPTAAAFAAGTLTACVSSNQPAPTAAPTTTLEVSGLGCPLCGTNADRSIIRIDGVTDARTDLSTGEIRVWTEPGADVDPEAIDEAVRDAGFTVERPASSVTPAGSGVDE